MLSQFLSEPLTAELQHEMADGWASNVPIPGRYYEILAGKGGLLATAGRAYGLGEGAERLKRAQNINNHPLNQRFWRPPENDFERKHFAQGIVSFTPRFTCGEPQGLAKGGEKRCFATIWIPPKEIARHPQLGEGTPWPIAMLRPRVEAAALVAPPFAQPNQLELCAVPQDACVAPNCPCPRSDVFVSGTDDRERVVNVMELPYKWSCSIFPLFRSSLLPEFFWTFVGGSGFLVSPKHVLTAAHIVHEQIDVRDAQGSLPLTADGAVIALAQHGPLGRWIASFRANLKAVSIVQSIRCFRGAGSEFYQNSSRMEKCSSSQFYQLPSSVRFCTTRFDASHSVHFGPPACETMAGWILGRGRHEHSHFSASQRV